MYICIKDIQSTFGRTVLAVGHSYGGLTVLQAAAENPETFAVIELVSSVGFHEITSSENVIQQYVQFMKGGVSLRLSDCIRALGGHHFGAHYVKDRLDKVEAIKDEILAKNHHESAYNSDFVKSFGVKCEVFVKLNDKVVPPKPTITHLGVDNVVILHPEATHFAPQTHPNQVAKATMIKVA